MLLDLESIFSNSQTITSSTESENVVKMASTQHNLTEVSFGVPVPLLIQVEEAFAGCSSVQVEVQTSATEDFSSAVTLVKTDTIAVGDLVSGYKFPINYIPKGNLGYMRLYYTVSGTASAGTITAGVVASHDNSFQDMNA